MQLRPRFVLVASAVFALIGCARAASTVSSAPRSPTARASLDDDDRIRQALARLTFGARPGDVVAVRQMGLARWIDLQLHPEQIPDKAADEMLSHLEIANKTSLELFADHPQPNEYGLTIAKGIDTAEIRRKAAEGMRTAKDSALLETKVRQGLDRATQIFRLGPARTAAARELQPSILVRAVASDRQLLETMTAFWENHFSVAAEKMPSPFTLVEYDRTIRAHALGKFKDLLRAVAKSSAMLFYLDNYQSYVDSLHPTRVEWLVEQRRRANPPLGDTSLAHTIKRRRTGLNENYARELMELHTLGVDGGYTQKDVQEVARALTGWTVENPQIDGAFVFQSQLHDAGEKTVLGVRMPGGRGIEDGEEVLDILARQPATARFVARKLVVRFVNDTAPPALVDRAAQAFLATDGDIREVVRTIVTSPEFNSKVAYRAKVKTPFELIASIDRAMLATPDTTQRTVQIISMFGQPIFGRQTPDGWPDQAAAWMNAGALMNRINLGARVAGNRFPNVTITDWLAGQRSFDASPEHVVQSVIDALLAGDASEATREALLAVRQPSSRLNAQQWNAYIASLVGVVIGSADFQRR
jgi:uncharacterized protein (DUF1800 family)